MLWIALKRINFSVGRRSFRVLEKIQYDERYLLASVRLYCIENAKNILTDLFPKIESLNHDVREDLAAEFADIGWCRGNKSADGFRRPTQYAITNPRRRVLESATQKKIIPKLIDDTVKVAMRAHKHNHSELSRQDYDELVESILGEGQEGEDREYELEVLYREGEESKPFV